MATQADCGLSFNWSPQPATHTPPASAQTFGKRVYDVGLSATHSPWPDAARRARATAVSNVPGDEDMLNECHDDDDSDDNDDDADYHGTASVFWERRLAKASFQCVK